MFKPKCLIAGKELPNAEEDYRASVKVEQYRVGKEALYLPEGLRWNYLPLSEIQSAADSHRVISAGHCVTVREERPALQLETALGLMTLNLEKTDSLPKLLKLLGKA